MLISAIFYEKGFLPYKNEKGVSLKTTPNARTRPAPIFLKKFKNFQKLSE